MNIYTSGLPGERKKKEVQTPFDIIHVHHSYYFPNRRTVSGGLGALNALACIPTVPLCHP
jgi:hypothetical protein